MKEKKLRTFLDFKILTVLSVCNFDIANLRQIGSIVNSQCLLSNKCEFRQKQGLILNIGN